MESVKLIGKCIVCGESIEDNVLMNINNLPASAQDIPTYEELKDDCGIDLNLCQCKKCGLIQFDCMPVDYYRDVIRAGGYSTTMVELRRAQYSKFIRLCNLENKKIIEIGCGQGEFINVLTEFPVQVYGIEHKPELVEMALSKGLNVDHNFAETSDTILKDGPFDAFLSFNFLEHQPDPNAMLQCIYNNLTDDGVGLVTVPSFEYIIENDAFYELLRDHIANYTFDSLRFLMNKNGFEVIDEEMINRDTISFIVRKRKKQDVSGLISNSKKLYDEMREFVLARTKVEKKVAVWGASHQGFTAISTTGISDDISYIIDSAPFKQNKYAPASHVKIVSPDAYFDDPVDCIIIIAPGYTQEINKVIKDRYGEKVEVAVLKSSKIELLK